MNSELFLSMIVFGFGISWICGYLIGNKKKSQPEIIKSDLEDK